MAHRQRGDYEAPPAVLPLGVGAQLRRVRPSAVRYCHPDDLLTPDDLHLVRAALPALSVQYGVRGEFDRYEHYVVTCRAGGQLRRQPSPEYPKLAFFAGEESAPSSGEAVN